MQIYLHISKKSSIFATDFNSGVHNNQKHKRVMKQKCIFKVCGGKEMCRVMVRKNEDGDFYYVVYHGRKLATTIARWKNVWDAIRDAERIACCDMREVCENVFDV